MSAIVRTYHAMTITRNGRVSGVGSLSAALAEQTVPGDFVRVEQLVTLSAGAKTRLWDYNDTLNFEKIVVRPLSGYLLLAKLVDRPVDAAAIPPNLAPSGAINQWQHMEHSCHDPLIINTDQAMVHATAATHVGHDAGTGLPGLWTASGREVGKVYALAAWNPSTTAAVDVLVTVIN